MFVASRDVGAGRSLIRDLRSGGPGCLPRIALSLAASTGVGAGTTLLLGSLRLLHELNDWTWNVDGDSVAALAFLLGSVFWLILLRLIWAGYPRRRHLLITLFGVLIIWSIAIALCVIIDLIFGWEGELLIVGTVMSAIFTSILLITSRWYRHAAGQPVQTPEGQVNVRCPVCCYSMVGLHETRCPECGTQYTVDELILRQGYGGTRVPEAESEVVLTERAGAPSAVKVSVGASDPVDVHSSQSDAMWHCGETSVPRA